MTEAASKVMAGATEAAAKGSDGGGVDKGAKVMAGETTELAAKAIVGDATEAVMVGEATEAAATTTWRRRRCWRGHRWRRWWGLT